VYCIQHGSTPLVFIVEEFLDEVSDHQLVELDSVPWSKLNTDMTLRTLGIKASELIYTFIYWAFKLCPDDVNPRAVTAPRLCVHETFLCTCARTTIIC